MTPNEIVIFLGLLLVVTLAAAYAWKKTCEAVAVERWQKVYADKLEKAHNVQAAARARDGARAAELTAEIARLRKNKKRHSHLVAELHALTSRRVLWGQGA